MPVVHLVIGVLATALMAATFLWGAWCWHRARHSVLFWRLLRAAQLVVVVEVALGGVLVALGYKESNLHLIYGLLPLAVSLIAEQLRLGAAQSVLDQRGFESSKDVGRLPADEQRAVVVAIVRREVGVMALAALVIVILLLRAAATGG